MRYLSLIIVGFLCLLSSSGQASELFGGHIDWKSVGKDSFEIRVVIYKDCSNRSFDKPTIRATSNCGAKMLSASIVSSSSFKPGCSTIPTCTKAATGKSLGIQKIVYSSILVVDTWRANGCCEFSINVSAPTRYKSIGNITSVNPKLVLTSRVDFCQNTTGMNTWTKSGAFSAPIRRDFIKKIQLRTTDTTDSVVYSLVDPQTSSGSIKYASTYSYNTPLSFLGFPKRTKSKPSGFHFDKETAELQFRPMKEEVTLIAVKANVYRSGKLIGTSTNELTIFAPKIVPTGSPKLSGINGWGADTTFSFCNKWNNCLDIVGRGSSSSTQVRLSYTSNLPPDAIISIKGSIGQTDTLQICWTPDTAKYPASGYYIKVTSKYNLCPALDSFTKTYYFNVSTPPKVSPTIAIDPLNCDSFRIGLDSPTTSRIQWSINGKDTSLTTSQFILHAKTKGSYRIKAVLDNCNLEEAFDTVEVLDLNNAKVSLSTAAAACAGDTIVIKATTLNAGSSIEYSWDYNTMDANLVSTSGNELHLIYLSSGIKRVRVLATDKSIDTLGCKTGRWLSLRARVLEQKHVLDKLYCDGDAAPSPIALPLYKNTSGWTGAGVQNDVFDLKKLPSYGTFDLDYRSIEGDTGACVHYTAQVRFYKSPNVTIGERPFKICKEGKGKAFSAQPLGGYWFGKGIGRSSGFFNPGNAGVGTHTLTYAYTDTINGCKSSDTTFVEVINKKPVIDIPTSITICGNADPIFIDAKPIGGFWTSEHFESKGSSVTIDPSKVPRADSYSITYKFEDSLQCSNIEGTTVHVTSFTKAQFYVEEQEVLQNDTVSIVNTSTIRNNTRFRWTVGSPIIASSNSLNPILTVSDTGYFDIKLVATDMVSSCIDSLRIKRAIYVKEPEIQSIEDVNIDFTVSPNPASNVLTIHSKTARKYHGQLIDLSGRSILRFNSTPHTSTIDISTLDNGTYTLSIANNDSIALLKVVIQH